MAQWSMQACSYMELQNLAHARTLNKVSAVCGLRFSLTHVQCSPSADRSSGIMSCHARHSTGNVMQQSRLFVL